MLRTIIRGLAMSLILAALGLSAFVWYILQPLPGLMGLTESKIINIASGSSGRSIAEQLYRERLISQPFIFEGLVRFSGRERLLKAGNYQFDTPLNWWELLQKLTDGDVHQQRLTIVEGWNFAQLKAAIRGHAGLRNTILDQPDAVILQAVGTQIECTEGVFFPDTYFFTPGESDVHILRRAYRLMQEKLQLSWEHRQPGLPYASPYELLILASLVEKETGKAADRTKIAAVFINRLRRGMRLQTDPSVIYGLGSRFDGDLRKADLLTDTPYNTYTRNGLPPTPIALPGMAALVAATQPAAVDYLYFVAKGDGSSYFSKNLEEHNRAVAQYQKKRKQEGT